MRRNMNNVLIVTPQNILPPGDGGKLCMYSRIVALYNENNKIYLAMGNTNVDVDNVYPDIMRYVSDYVVLPRASVEMKKADFIACFFEIARWFLSGKPRQAHTLHSNENRKKLMEFVKEKKINVIVLETIFSGELLDLELCKKENIRLVLVEHNVEYKFIKDCLFNMKIPVSIESRRVKKYERSILKKADLVVALSPKDAEILKKDFQINKLKYLPTTLSASTLVWNNTNSDYILFAGSLKFPPNYYSIIWFLKNVWTEFTKSHPNLKLKITGANTEKIRNEIHCYPNVVFTGFLDEYEFNLLKVNALFEIIPIIIGSGIKIKLLEALSIGIPVIATKHCYEGVPYKTDNAPYYVANNDADFLKAMEIFATNNDVRLEYSHNGKVFYNDIYASAENKNNWIDLLEAQRAEE